MYRNFADVARACAQRGIGPAQLFLESECRLTERAPDEVRAQLRERWAASRTRRPGAPSPRAWPRNNARQNAPGVLSWG